MTASDNFPEGYLDSWNTVVAMVLVLGSCSIPRRIMDTGPGDPGKSGLFSRSVGKIRGQFADWRCSIDDSSLGIHVVEYPDRYEVHVDAHDPHKTPLRHLLLDYYPPQIAKKIVKGILESSTRNQR